MKLLSISVGLLLSLDAFAHEGHTEHLAAIDAGLLVNPGDAKLLLERAGIHQEERKFDLALADLEAAARSEPGKLDYALLRCRLRLAAGQARAALAEVEASLLRQPQNPEALLWRGRCRRELGDGAAAQLDFDLACRDLRELTPELVIEKARLALLPGGAGALGAAAALEAEGKRCPASAVLLAEKQKIETDAGLFEAALITVERRIALSRAPEALLLDKSRLLSRLKRDSEAQQTLQQLRRLIAEWPAHLHEVPALKKLEEEALKKPGTPPSQKN